MDKNYKLGLTAIIGCNLVWGLLPIYWKMLIPIPSSCNYFLQNRAGWTLYFPCMFKALWV